MGSTLIYTPPEGLRTALDDFRDYVNKEYRLSLRTYDDLHSFSINRLNAFWVSIWKFTGIKASVHSSKAIDETVTIDKLPRFFEDTRLNFAENLLLGDDDAIAVIEHDEYTLWSPRKYTWKELRHLVGQYSDALRRAGIKKGDIVAQVGSNCVRSLAILLGSAAIGAVSASFATDIGEKALNDRLSQIRPRLLIAESVYSYNGKINNTSAKITACAKKVNEMTDCRLIVSGSTSKIGWKCTDFDTFIVNTKPAAPVYEQLPFNTPLLVMFSSGTTNLPKCIVHSHGGLTLNGIKEHRLHNNFGPQDIHFHFSNIGWTLWNISIGAMFCKTTMVLYDGSLFYPSPERFLEGIFKDGITGFGAGPRYYSELQKRNICPKNLPGSGSIHTILSTGAVLTPGLATWLGQEAFGQDVCQIGFSGGTELCGSFMHGTRSLPSYAGEIAVKELGMDVDCFDSEGKSLPLGETGELVCKKPFPNMPVKFLNDPDGEKYQSSYFHGFPNVWTHGDLIRVSPITHGISVLGRSDGILNPSGIRFGTSEIYNILSVPKFSPSILDALVVGQQRATQPYSDDTEQVVLFLKCAPTTKTGTILLNKDLEEQVRQKIQQDLSRRHVPTYIFETFEVPYNVNGKKLEIQVKKVLNGGRRALEKLKATEQEKQSLQWFVKFFDVEKVVESEGKVKAKM